MEAILLLRVPPIAFEAIWGDGRLAKQYHYDIAEGHDINRTPVGGGFDANYIIRSGQYEGKTIDWLYQNHPDHFGTAEQRRWEMLPISMGVCYACENLSVQVHPREDWAQEHLGMHGKSECWYFVDCAQDATVVVGHRANSMEELEDYIDRGDWEGLMCRVPIHPGSFHAIKAGTLHAVQKGSFFIEICNPSPITYRFYDYDRLDRDGKPRKLDLEHAKENILIPYQPIVYEPIESRYDGVVETWLADNEDYSVWRYEVNGSGIVPMKKSYGGCYVIKGNGTVDGMPICEGESFFISASAKQIKLTGDMTILCCHG